MIYNYSEQTRGPSLTEEEKFQYIKISLCVLLYENNRLSQISKYFYVHLKFTNINIPLNISLKYANIAQYHCTYCILNQHGYKMEYLCDKAQIIHNTFFNNSQQK